MKLNEPTKTELATRQKRIDNAVRLLTHYFSVVYIKAGLKWDSDNDAELRELIELLFWGRL